jgi:hypothetical protein
LTATCTHTPSWSRIEDPLRQRTAESYAKYPQAVIHTSQRNHITRSGSNAKQRAKQWGTHLLVRVFEEDADACLELAPPHLRDLERRSGDLCAWKSIKFIKANTLTCMHACMYMYTHVNT